MPLKKLALLEQDLRSTQLSTHFSAYDLICVGETYEKYQIDNTPSNQSTLDGLRNLAEVLLEPINTKFGRPIITYCLATPMLTKYIKKNISPELDQHAGSELRRSGQYICSRRGQAIDIIHPKINSLDLSKWIIENIEFDRLYYYGPDRPIHVSIGPDSSRSVIYMQMHNKGRRVPKKISLDWLKKISSF